MATDFKKAIASEVKIDIRSIGSQHNVNDWEGKIGLAFSSPPYFDLEHYNIGDQSIDCESYEDWLSGYWRGTVLNIKKYLISGGYFLLNMKNIKNHNTLDDMCKIIELEGFEFVENIELKNIQRVSVKRHLKNTNEVISVFYKK